jgi:ketosteroid isomerase-like protein
MAGMDQPVQWSNRVTHIFRCEGEWRLVHRHANRLEERYEPSRVLKERQEQS